MNEVILAPRECYLQENIYIFYRREMCFNLVFTENDSF
jgi:hypothetical protein